MKIKLKNLINHARKSGDKNALTAYQAALASIQERENRENKDYNDEQVVGIIQKERDKFKEMFECFQKAGRDVDGIQCQINALEALLPEMIPMDQYDSIVDSAITSTDSKTIKDMGKVMAEVKKSHGNLIDMGKVSGIVKMKLV